MYSRRGFGLGYIATEVGAAAGPAGVAVGLAIDGLAVLLGLLGGNPVAASKIQQFQANPTIENAVDARNYLMWLEGEIRATAPGKGSQGEQYGGYNDVTPWIEENIARLDDYIQKASIVPSPMNYQSGPDGETVEQAPGPIFGEPSAVFSVDVEADPNVTLIPAGAVVIGGDSYPTTEKAGASVLPFILPPLIGTTIYGSQTATGPQSSGGSSSGNPFLNPSNYGFLYRFLPQGDQPRDPGGCDCSGKEPNYLAWLAAVAAGIWATSGRESRRRRRKAERKVRVINA